VPRFVLVEGEGFEPSKAEPSDLQSDPFDRSGTPPNETEHYGDFPYLCQTVGAIFCLAPGARATGVRISYHGARNPAPMSPVTTLLRRVLNPRSVAVIGASDSTEKFGGRVMNFVVKHGFEGAVIPVNPSASTIRGIRAYAAIGDAPGPVDVALLAVPNAHIASAVEACGAAGVAACVVLTADFAELGNEGEARQNDLVQAAQRHGVRLIGPNCLGFINPALRLALTSSIALAIEPMPVGGIGLVSQSGSLMAALISHAQDVGTGFSAAI
jgi:predicted CoA-binding protein